MAEHRVTAATIAAKVSSAAVVAGDVILMEGTGYSSLPKSKANLTFRAFDYEADPYKAVTDGRGRDGRGFGVKVTDFLNSLPAGTKIEGIFWDSSGRRGINGAHTTAPGIKLYGCACTDRPTDGSRRIGFTVGDTAGEGLGFEFHHGRWFRQGKRGDTHDHPFYFKKTKQPKVHDSILEDAGWFPLHLYPECDDGDFQRLIIWGSGSAVAYSGGGNSSTGVSGRSERNRLEWSIIGAGHGAPGAQQEGDGYLIEGFGGGSGNLCRFNVITRGGGRALLYKPGLVGVTYEGNIDVQPEWLNGDPLVTGDYRQTATSPAKDRGPLMTRPGWTGGPIVIPPPDPGPDPAPPPSSDTSPPVLEWVRPEANAVLSGSFLYTATAADPSGIEWVEFRLINASQGIDRLLFRELSAPYGETPFDTSLLPDGPYSLTATARDRAGNQSVISRAVTVANTVVPPPPDPDPDPPPPDPDPDLEAELAAALAALAREEAAHAITAGERDSLIDQVTRIRAGVAAETQRHLGAIADILED